jgi:rubrerythrin
MAVSFSIDEIFEMAEQIEANGGKFYRKASKMTDDESTSRTFMDLAVMEDGHYEIFKDMRKNLAPEEKEQVTFDPDNESGFYLQAMANLHGSEGKKDRDIQLTGKETINEIFRIAVDAEKNSIIFYTALKDLVSGAGKGKVADIIREELGHLVILQGRLAQLM